MKTHPYGIKRSDIPIGNPKNPIIKEWVSEKILITTELWDEFLLQPWTFEELKITKNKAFKLIMKWEESKNYAVTKVVNDNNEIICYYVDICSSIKRAENEFVFYDWYLDVVKKPNEKPKILDEDEFEKAVELGYLVQDEADLARRTVYQVVDMLERNKVNF